MLTATQIRMDKLNKFQDGTRTLLESIAIPDVAKALKDWVANASNPGVLIGGCAVSYHARPRATTDADVLYLDKDKIPFFVDGFKRTRPGAFQHKETHVEIELTHPGSFDTPIETLSAVCDNAIVSDGMKVASPTGLVAMKLFRLKNNDVGDIVAMHKARVFDLSVYGLSDDKLAKYEQIIREYGW